MPKVVATLRDRPGFQHVVITGRNAHPALVEAAVALVALSALLSATALRRLP